MILMKALLVIDMQNVCVGKNHATFFKYNHQELIDEVNKAIDANKDNYVIYIRNLTKRNLINMLAPFRAYEGTPEADFAEELKIVSDFTFDKYVGDAFSNAELGKFLKENDVTEIEIVGVDGGGCVSLTAIGAVNNGFKVTVNTKAVGTMFNKNKEKYFKKLSELGAEFI